MDALERRCITTFSIPSYTLEPTSFCGIFVLSAVHYKKVNPFQTFIISLKELFLIIALELVYVLFDHPFLLSYRCYQRGQQSSPVTED